MQGCLIDALPIIHKPYGPIKSPYILEKLLEQLAKEETADNILVINEQLHYEWTEENENLNLEDQETKPPIPHEYWELLKLASQWLTMLQQFRYFTAEFTISIKLTFNKLTI